MDVISWTGELACQLQTALRLSNEAFADQLGVHRRTVGDWHARPEIVPRAEIQAALDTIYERSSAPVRSRFARLAWPSADSSPVQALRVAIAVVLRGAEVLLVQRRDGGDLHWQFPAGVVKPGAEAAAVAVKETRAETGVHCTVREALGSRLHPATGVQADYLICDHLMGEPSNLDPAENAEAAFVPIASLTRFIPADRIFRPVLDALGVAA